MKKKSPGVPVIDRDPEDWKKWPVAFDPKKLSIKLSADRGAGTIMIQLLYDKKIVSDDSIYVGQIEQMIRDNERC